MNVKRIINEIFFYLFNACIFLGIYVALLYIYIIKCPLPASEVSVPDFWDFLHNEFANWATILPIVCPILSNWLIKKYKPDCPTKITVIWSALLGVLIVIYRVAVGMRWNRVVFELLGIGHFIVAVIISVSFTLSSRKEYIPTDSILRKAMGGAITNKNILSVQLFRCQQVVENGNQIFWFQNFDSICNKNCEDVNCILSLKLYLPVRDYNQFYLSLQTYESMIQNGADEDGKREFRNVINTSKQGIINRLNAVPLDEITHKESCLARLLVCYAVLEEMIDKPSLAIVDLFDGTLGVEIDKEKQLFSSLRTGMLGAVLLGNHRRYYFRYRRDGKKDGRKYCAFVLDSSQSPVPNLEELVVCLVSIKEGSGDEISASIIEWISKMERQVTQAYNISKGAK